MPTIRTLDECKPGSWRLWASVRTRSVVGLAKAHSKHKQVMLQAPWRIHVTDEVIARMVPRCSSRVGSA